MSVCPKCRGSGKVVPVRNSTCVVCGGSGSRYQRDCRLCYGTGNLMMPAERKGFFFSSGTYDCPICEGTGQFFGNYDRRIEDLAKNRG